MFYLSTRIVTTRLSAMHEIFDNDLEYKMSYEFIETVKLHVYAEREKVTISVSNSDANACSTLIFVR